MSRPLGGNESRVHLPLGPRATCRRPGADGKPHHWSMLRIGIAGCGDVAHRHYLPGLESRSDAVRVVAAADPAPGAALRVVEAIAGWSPGATPYEDVGSMLE